MGKGNISFLIVWIIWGQIFATLSSDPESTTSTEFGKTDLSVCCLSFLIRAQLCTELCIRGAQVN